MKAITDSNRHITERHIAKNVLHTTIDNHIKRLGLGLGKVHPTKRINDCDTHLKSNTIDPFFKQIITGDKTCIVCTQDKI